MSRKRKPKYEEKTLREKQIDFKRHLRTYLVMSVFFIALNMMGHGRITWAVWPILGWGIGVAMQALSLYGPLKDPDDVHPKEEDIEFSGPLPDIKEKQGKIPMKEYNDRGYSEEDLV